MSSDPAEPRPLASAVGATLVAVDGAPPASRLLQELRREVLDVSIASPEIFDGATGTDHLVVILWLGESDPGDLFDRASAWAGRREPRPGLMACAPVADRGLAERALSASFDDVILGPPSTLELAARIRAVHRRVHWARRASSGRVRYGSMTLNTDGHELWMDGQSVALTSTELAVVRILMRAQGRTLSRNELLDAAWGSANLEISERAVDNVILRLRRKLPRPEVIQTVRGVGFRLASD